MNESGFGDDVASGDASINVDIQMSDTSYDQTFVSDADVGIDVEQSAPSELSVEQTSSELSVEQTSPDVFTFNQSFEFDSSSLPSEPIVDSLAAPEVGPGSDPSLDSSPTGADPTDTISVGDPILNEVLDELQTESPSTDPLDLSTVDAPTDTSVTADPSHDVTQMSVEPVTHEQPAVTHAQPAPSDLSPLAEPAPESTAPEAPQASPTETSGDHGRPEPEYWQDQKVNGWCGPASVAMVLSEFTHHEYTVADVAHLADSDQLLHWNADHTQIEGMYTRDLSTLLAQESQPPIQSHVVDNASLQDLEAALDRGKDVIMFVDAHQIWKDAPSDGKPDHFLLCTEINETANPPYVVLNDSGNALPDASGKPTGLDEKVPLATFEAAWAASQDEMVVTNESPEEYAALSSASAASSSEATIPAVESSSDSPGTMPENIPSTPSDIVPAAPSGAVPSGVGLHAEEEGVWGRGPLLVPVVMLAAGASSVLLVREARRQ